MSLNAGKLNRRIRISKRVTTLDALNQPSDTWETHGLYWADVRAPTGLGVIKSGAAGVDVDINAYSIRLRFVRGIDAGMRVELLDEPGVYFNIQSVRSDYARREWTDLVTAVGGNDG
jgi:SPP1 family predicted phage head-tail adaptor